MIKKCFNIIKKIIFAFFIIYSFNMIMEPLSINIPINMISVLGISFLGLPGLLSIIVVFLIVF